MTELDELLARSGLARGERLLVVATVATWRADWATLADCIKTARDGALSRAELEEALLQGVLFYGFPRSVSAFEALDSGWPVERPPSGGALPAERRAAAGRALFDSIYGDNSAAVRDRLAGFHREFHDFVLECAYGRVLTRPGLRAAVRELCAIGVLAAMDQVPQMIAHARGALRLGAELAEVREALFTGVGDDDTVARHMRRIAR